MNRGKKKDFFDVDVNFPRLKEDYTAEEAGERVGSKRGFRKMFGG